MQIIECEKREGALLAALVDVWERSVRATHAFLSEEEIYGVEELTVNEQNPDAVGFYEHLGFRTYKRTELDEEGRPYPLLYMRREATLRE